MRHLVLPLLLSVACLSHAAVNKKEVRFQRGAASATVSDAVVRGDSDVYTLGAAKDQVMEITIASLEDNAVFEVFAPGARATGDGDIQGQRMSPPEARRFAASLPASGQYLIVVSGTRGNAHYKLHVAIAPKGGVPVPAPFAAGALALTDAARQTTSPAPTSSNLVAAPSPAAKPPSAVNAGSQEAAAPASQDDLRRQEWLLGKWNCKAKNPYGVFEFKRGGTFTWVPGTPDLEGKREPTSGAYVVREGLIRTVNHDIGVKIDWKVASEQGRSFMMLLNQGGLLVECNRL